MRAFAQRIGKLLQTRYPVEDHCFNAGIGRSQMQQTAAGKSHACWQVGIGMINAKQVDAALDIGQDAALGPGLLRGNFIAGCETLQPVGDQGDADNALHGDPLPGAIESGRMVCVKGVFSTSAPRDAAKAAKSVPQKRHLIAAA